MLVVHLYEQRDVCDMSRRDEVPCTLKIPTFEISGWQWLYPPRGAAGLSGVHFQQRPKLLLQMVFQWDRVAVRRA